MTGGGAELPTSWNLAAPADELTGRMVAAVNDLMLDVLAAVACKDYGNRRRRQAEGTARDITGVVKTPL